MFQDPPCIMSQSRQVIYSAAPRPRMSVDDERHGLDVVLFTLMFKKPPQWESLHDTVDQCILKLNQARETEHPVTSALQLILDYADTMEQNSDRHKILSYVYMEVMAISRMFFFDHQNNAHKEAASNPYLLDLSP